MMPPQANTFQPQPPKGNSKFTVFITIITILFLVIVAYKNMDNISELFGSQATTGTISGELQVGQQVSMEGVITSNGDFINYTHQLATTSNGTFGLKSKTIDLSIYTGIVTIEGTVEKVGENMTIIEITNIIGSTEILTGEQTTGLEIKGVYLEKAGIYFPENFFNEYELLNSGENNTIKIKHLTTDQAIDIDYFTCKTSNPSENCTQLKDSFKNTNDKVMTTSNNDTFYKLEGIDSRFVTNTLYGYFINNVPVQEVTTLSQNFILLNNDYANENFADKIPTLCVDGNIILEKADKMVVILESNKTVLKATGKVNSGNAECKIAMDPSIPTLGTKLSFYYPEAGSITTTIPTAQGQSVTANPSVQQFPINLEKALTYTSSKGGYVIVFPSSNISYAAYNTQTNLNIDGINCSIQVNVIKYSDKANLETNPTVKIYECRAKNTDAIPSNYITKTLEDGRVFVIDAVDAARVDFANNIVIE